MVGEFEDISCFTTFSVLLDSMTSVEEGG
jgi:hypothetical protein